MKEVWSKTNLLALNWFRGKFKKRKKEKKRKDVWERVKKSHFGFFFFCSLCVCLGWRLLRCVSVSTFSPFFFFFHAFFPSQAATIHVLYMNSSRNIWPVLREQCIRSLFTDPRISFFINFFIKNGSHGTIYIFKNYFAIVFSVFSFSKISFIQTHPNCHMQF